MGDPTNAGKKTLDNITSVVTNKRSRSFIFLIVTFALILAANGLLPLISGQAHYTANPVEMTYSEYVELKKANVLNDLTYGSKMKISMYKDLHILANPELSPEDKILLEPPGAMKVSVYTEFFFESEWWYFSTGISLLSAVFLFYALFNYLIIRSKDTHIDHLNGEFTIKQLNEKYLDPDTFEPWIDDEFNKARKIKQHTRNVRYDLKQLEMKNPYEVRRRFKEYFNVDRNIAPDNRLPVLYQPLTKQEQKYLNTKEELLSQLEQTYIDTYVVDNDVKYFKEIKPGFIYSGINYHGIGQDEYSLIKTDQQRVRNTMASKILMSLSITLAFASILTVLAINVEEQDPLWLFITILMKIVPLLLQVYFAIDYNNWFMENQLLPNLKARENIALLYLAEMKRRGTLTEAVVINKLTVETKKGADST